MIRRAIEAELHALLGEYPIVTILGPRQAGKTTLARMALPEFSYCNLEEMGLRDLARSDPAALLRRFPGPVIFDEIQRVPELLSYLQVKVDESGGVGHFVLTGSHQLALGEAIAQSLAGRTALLRLYPLSIAELRSAGIQYADFESYAFTGFLPRVHDQKQRPSTAYASYYQTYVERDVRQLINLKDASRFEKFMKLFAGRIGQVINYASLAGDVGVSAATIKDWLSILEASFIVFRLTPYFENFGKRVIKSPQYYFVEIGLLSYLLGVETKEQISRDPLYGSIFENLVVIECLKSRCNQGRSPSLYFYRDSRGSEVDILAQTGRELMAIEIKASSTYHRSLIAALSKARALSPRVSRTRLVYSGEALDLSCGTEIRHFSQVDEVLARL
jgi:predicted AAA+ superfamily ATPase